METAVFLISAAIVIIGAIGVIVRPNPVHAALSLVATLFGVAVLFIAQEAHLLAAVQVIVYAGAIVILFLFVIMLLGVDQVENLRVEPLAGQRPLALLVGGLGLAGLLTVIIATSADGVGEGAVGPIDEGGENVEQIARVLFSDQLLSFEITGVLLTIAVVGAVVLARRPPQPDEGNEEGAD
jgi:NADH-quinone oxidoreductase subunit J